jgi:hypothetical protein
MLTALHGAQSTQLKVFLDGSAAISKGSSGAGNAVLHLRQHAYGTIENAIAEVEGGLIVSLRAQVAGEIFLGVGPSGQGNVGRRYRICQECGGGLNRCRV